MLHRYKADLTFFFIVAMIAGMLLAERSPVILSSSMIGLLLVAIVTTPTSTLFGNFLARKDLFILSLSYLFLLSSFLYSESYGYLLERLQIKIPLLVLPFAAASLEISPGQFKRLLASFMIIILGVSLFTFLNYLTNQQEITEAYLRSKIMPGPVNHIRFSLMIAFAAYVCFYLYSQSGTLIHKLEKGFLVAAGIFLTVFVHIYSVRSGIIALYGIFVSAIAVKVIRQREFVKGLAALFLLMAVGYAGIRFSPTLQNKIINTKADIEVYMSNASPNYSSISTRLISYEIALDIYRHNKLWGCGLGDLRDQNLLLYKSKHPDIVTPIIPHNQFLFYLASTGLIGTLAFCICFFLPLFIYRNYRNDVLLFHYVVLFLSFQTEPMLETQLGVGYTILFIILPLMVKRTPAPELQ